MAKTRPFEPPRNAQADRQIQQWIGQAVAAITEIRREQLAAIAAETNDLVGAADRVRNALAEPDPRVVEIVNDLLILGQLKGREIVQRVHGRADETIASVELVNADLFEKLPFKEAIDALLDKLAVTRDVFDTLDAFGRSRTFTMARVANDVWVDAIHQEITQSIETGETFRTFWERVQQVAKDTDWIGTTERHGRLVYEQNIGTAYSAGRMQQGRELGIRAWRKLASLSDEPRSDHAQWDGMIFRLTADTPLFPIDYNCNCGWELVDDVELEQLGIDPDTLPVFAPPPSPTGYVPSLAGAYAAMKEDAMKTTHAHNRLLVCDLVEVVDPASRILIMPWGRVSSKAGDFLVDRFSAESIAERMQAHGADIPIDAEHHTVGGKFSAPDGTAVARGWIKSIDAVAGEGIYANVEWTAEGADWVANKKYRYLSPVVRVDGRGRAFELHSVALTNKPAIAGMKPIVNSDPGVPGGDPATAAGQPVTKENSMDAKEFARQLQETMQLKSADRPGKIAELTQQAIDAGLIDPQIGVLILTATGIGDDAGGEESAAAETVANAIAKGDLAGAINGASTLVCSLRGEITELKGKLAASQPAEDVRVLKERLEQVERVNRDREFDGLLQAHSGRIPPANVADFRKWWDSDRKAAESFLAGTAPQLSNKPVEPPANQRDLVINSAKGEYAGNTALQSLTNGRAFVNDQLRFNGLAVLSDEEAAKLAI